MDCTCLTYLLYFLLAFIIWVIITKCMNRGGNGGEGSGDGGTGTGDNDSDEPDIPEVDPRDQNLLKNNCGQEKLSHWKIINNGGEGWIVEDPPVGADKLPKSTDDGQAILEFAKYSSCFATSDDLCMKEQVIDLLDVGFKESELDNEPPIKVSEWCASHADCDGNYIINVTLLNKEKGNMKSFMKMEKFEKLPRKKWHKVSYTFSNYGPGVRFVSFNHGGQSSERKSGHFGAKISGGAVRVLRDS